VSTFLGELIQTGVYKRSQGRVTRQVTFAAAAITLVLGVWRLSVALKLSSSLAGVYYGVPGLLLLAGLWIAYRVVNVPAFADFLIAVEAEMNKVSWPSRSELIRASMVVLITIFALAVVLAVFDMFWRVLFTDVLRIF